jgi:hypothetical protein
MAQKIVTSEAYELIKQDLYKWGMNFLKFSAPAVLVGLVALKGGSLEVALTSFGWAIYGAFIDLLKKYVEETRYKV